jgi:hypothetical protein
MIRSKCRGGHTSSSFAVFSDYRILANNTEAERSFECAMHANVVEVQERANRPELLLVCRRPDPAKVSFACFFFFFVLSFFFLWSFHFSLFQPLLYS